jgi:hypothetical protein
MVLPVVEVVVVADAVVATLVDEVLVAVVRGCSRSALHILIATFIAVL